MKFCVNCENMYYLKLNEEDETQLSYYCRNCEHVDNNIDMHDLVAYKHEQKENLKNILINKYTKYDPTLPRLNTIRCPNDKCSTNTGNESREVVYIRYDNSNMKYVYLCCKCDFKWKT